MSFKWDRSRRLRQEQAIRQVYSQGTRVKMARGALFFLPAEDLRVAISVSKKTGMAVVRNRQKRLVREFFRLHQEEFLQPFWMMFVVYQPYKNLGDLSSELLEACQRAGILVCKES
ncbi:MAG: ribonuclease P protein component [Brevinematales bacterium]|jgi:ribonuclease P protein component|nr:ribonuclease P protein component [Brevinematales bacterium]